MGLKDLSKEQLTLLKQNYLCNTQGTTSWADLANADNLVTMEMLEQAYGGIDFTDDDFAFNDERKCYSY